MTKNNDTQAESGLPLYAIERSQAGDFPFYNGAPVALSGVQWLIVLLGVILGFLALTVPILPMAFYETTLGTFVPAILFFALPLIALAAVAGPHWRALFRTPGWRDFLLMIGIALLNLIVAVAVVLLVRLVFAMNANPVGDMLGAFSSSETVLFYLKTLPQLFGEEVVSILPFLALLWLCHQKLQLSRKSALLLAWLGTALFFGAIHLPTYGWNWVQCFLVIGSARLVLLLGYIITKNIWVSTGAHIINDWLIFTLIVVMGPEAVT
tara:strand:- start:1392 stop:2189 length:798 start_codon:yes stop_codon:yes gene_type:complete